MADFVNPTPFLAELAELFLDAASGDGITLDAELCRAFADGLGETATFLAGLIDLAELRGLLERPHRAPSSARSPSERRLIAAMAAPLDPEGRVLAFPIGTTRPTATEGGSAA